VSISSLSLRDLQSRVRDVPDFPKPGIIFKDITPLLSEGNCFRQVVELLSDAVPKDTTKIAAIESRGFILGSAVAHHLQLGLTLIRKPGKLPGRTLSQGYELEYGRDALQIHADALTPSDKVFIIDDVLATGGTASAAEALCLKAGALVTGFQFLIELVFLEGRMKLKAPAQSLFRY